MSSVPTFRDRFNNLASIEEDRNKLIAELLEQHESQNKEVAILRLDLQQEKDNRREQQERVQLLEAEQRRHRENNPFVLVVLDGDGILFLEKYISNGAEGGADAANELKLRLNDYLQSLEFGHYNIRLVIYMNLFDLANTYVKKGTFHSVADMFKFVGGFNRKFPLFQIVDAGQGKECADTKIHEEFKLFINNIHCKKILLGGPHDRGYARLLDQYSGNKKYSERIVLVKSVPFVSELRRFVDARDFEVTSFNTVFKQEMLVWNGYSPGKPSPPMAAPPGLVKRVPGPSIADTPPLFRILGTAEVLRNKDGYRIDTDVAYSESKRSSLQKKKLCNQFYLLGVCTFKKPCLYDHDQRLNDDFLKALINVSRLSVCSKGVGCEDIECIKGHNCPWNYCNRSVCQYPRETHGMDKKPVKIVTV